MKMNLNANKIGDQIGVWQRKESTGILNLGATVSPIRVSAKWGAYILRYLQALGSLLT